MRWRANILDVDRLQSKTDFYPVIIFLEMSGPTPTEVDIAYCKSILQLATAFDSAASPLFLRDFGEDDWGIADAAPRRDFLRSCISNAGATADDESMGLLWGMMDDDFARVQSIDDKLADFVRLVVLIIEPLRDIDKRLIEYHHAKNRAETEETRTDLSVSTRRDRERCRTTASTNLQFAPFEYFIVAFDIQQCRPAMVNGRRSSPLVNNQKTQAMLSAKLKESGSIEPAFSNLWKPVSIAIFEMLETERKICRERPDHMSERLTNMRAAAADSRDRVKALEWFANQLDHSAARVPVYRGLRTMVTNVLYHLGQVFRMLDIVALACQYTQRRLASQ